MNVRLGIRPLLLAALAVLLCVGRAGAEGRVETLAAYRSDGWLGIELRARDLLDERTTSTVESGLPGTCVYQFEIEDRKGRTIGQRLFELSLRLDLWENLYVLSGPQGSFTLSSLAAADSALSHLSEIRLLPLGDLHADREYRLTVRVAVQPLGAEGQKRITRAVSGDGTRRREEFSLNVGKLLDRFLSRGGGEKEMASLVGPFFRITDLGGSP